MKALFDHLSLAGAALAGVVLAGLIFSALLLALAKSRLDRRNRHAEFDRAWRRSRG